MKSAPSIPLEVPVSSRNATPRFVHVVVLVGIAVALAAGCGGGGSSSSSSGGGGGGALPTTAPSSIMTAHLNVGPSAASATFSPSPLPIGSLGNVTAAISAPVESATAAVTATLTTTLPNGIASPSSVLRRPESIGAQNLKPLAYLSLSAGSAVSLSASPTLALTFASAPTGLTYVYLAECNSAGTTWTTVGPASLSGATLTVPIPAVALTTSQTWFVIFTASAAVNPTSVPTSAPSSSPISGATAAPLPDALQFNVNGLYGEVIANGLPAPRQLVALPNGDLLVGTDDKSGTVWIVPKADGTGAGGTPKVFVTVPNVSSQEPAQGIAFDPVHNELYIATNQSVWQVPYHTGDQSEPTPSVEIAKVRRGGISTNPNPSDGDVHFTSSVAIVPSTNMLYVGVGSSCNACVENNDPTRGTIQKVNVSSGQSSQALAASRFRNALALTVNPATNTLWAGGAGQDDLLALDGSVVINDNSPYDGHPYEFFDPVSTHNGIPDYGWPVCEENDHLYNPLNAPSANCKAVAPATTGSNVNDVQPAVELFAYSTIIGAVFYPANQTGANAFPASALPGGLGGAFLSMHGSWHESAANMEPIAVPELVYVPMSSGTDRPQTGAFSGSTWTSGSQWDTVLYGFQDPITGNRVGRPVGLAVGPTGSLFVADDYAGVIYRIRPGTAPGSKTRRPR
jgi:glucose/arabinose dehydrogenase